MNTRARAVLALLGASALGLVAGVTLDREWLQPRPAAMMSEEALLAAMTRDVGLDSSQARAVKVILDRHQGAVDSAWRSVRPNVHAAIRAAQAEIDALLRPDQRDRYRRWIRNAHSGMTDSTHR